VLGFVVSLLAAATAAPATPGAVDSLAAAERSFSAMSVERGMRDAFLAFLADDAVIFRPLPINGQESWRQRSAVPGTLIWEPSYAEISSAHDLGYTTGPWEYRPPGDAKAEVAHGHFFSVWKKQANGDWRVALDIGVSHEKPERGLGGAFTSREAATKPALAGSTPELASLDVAVSRATRAKGIAAGYVAGSTSDLRFATEGALPKLGATAARAVFDSMKGELRLETQGSGVAASRDLAYTYGIAGRWVTRDAKAPADSCVYLNVWRRDPQGRFRLALAVLNPVRRR
jgi:ketosteroid isomerase-like protein